MSSLLVGRRFGPEQVFNIPPPKSETAINTQFWLEFELPDWVELRENILEFITSIQLVVGGCVAQDFTPVDFTLWGPPLDHKARKLRLPLLPHPSSLIFHQYQLRVWFKDSVDILSFGRNFTPFLPQVLTELVCGLAAIPFSLFARPKLRVVAWCAPRPLTVDEHKQIEFHQFLHCRVQKGVFGHDGTGFFTIEPKNSDPNTARILFRVPVKRVRVLMKGTVLQPVLNNFYFPDNYYLQGRSGPAHSTGVSEFELRWPPGVTRAYVSVYNPAQMQFLHGVCHVSTNYSTL